MIRLPFAKRKTKQELARERLQEMIDRNCRAPATIEYARRREAGLLGHQRRGYQRRERAA